MSTIALQNKLDKVDSLSFGMLKELIIHDYGENIWDVQKLNDVEYKYKAFLKVKILHPDVSLVPDVEIDMFWHHHILDTRKYSREMQDIFGQPLHHNPYLGQTLNSIKKRDLLFARTKELLQKHFDLNLTSNVGSACTDGDDYEGYGNHM